jgi:hypothetical protein
MTDKTEKVRDLPEKKMPADKADQIKGGSTAVPNKKHKG